MANEEQLSLLRQGVEAWNQWRIRNRYVQIDLFSANLCDADLRGAKIINADLRGANLSSSDISSSNLCGADLSGAKLIDADLRSANLRGANLSSSKLIDADLRSADLSSADLRGANLRGANLSSSKLIDTDLRGTDLRSADLRGANLRLSQAVSTKFINADLTGVCILDWHINRETNFEGVECNFIYRGFEIKQEKFLDRLPINPVQEFSPGEFEEWIRISAEAQTTIDLTFADGVDWQSFFQSLQEVRQEYPEADVSLQAIEKKGSAFVIRLESSPDANKSAIESLTTELYETKSLLREAQGELKAFYRMSDVLEKLADKPMSPNEFHFHDKVGSVAGTNEGEMKTIQHNYPGEIRQTPAESAKEIQDLLLQLQQSNPADIEALVEQRVKNDPTLRDRIRNALKEGGLETMKVIFPLTGIAIETVRGWVEAEGD